MNEHERDRIAAALNQLRPDWPVKSLRTLLDKPELATRPRRDVVVALGWVACEPNTHTPARVLEAGPWWRATAVDATATARRHTTRDEACVRCAQPYSDNCCDQPSKRRTPGAPMPSDFRTDRDTTKGEA